MSRAFSTTRAMVCLRFIDSTSALNLRNMSELGILVWQDLCGFACGVYPTHQSFVQQVTAEAEANVMKLAHHPCIIVWCGNNEDYQQINQWKGTLVI